MQRIVCHTTRGVGSIHVSSRTASPYLGSNVVLHWMYSTKGRSSTHGGMHVSMQGMSSLIGTCLVALTLSLLPNTIA